MRTSFYLPMAGLVLFLVAPPLQAQGLHEHEAIPKEQIKEADNLFRRAEALMATCDRAQWKEAAELFEKSARMRPCHDPKIFQGLFQAAEIAAFSDETGKAQRLMAEAAEHAMHVGDIENAVEAYVQAAHLAAALGDRRAVTYVAMAEDLAHSPLLGVKGRDLQAMIAAHFTRGGG